MSEIAWAAGLFEGEGCLGSWQRGSREYARVQLCMKDRDIVERFAAIVGSGEVRPKKRHRSYPDHWSDMYEWTLTDCRSIEMFISTILPWLGERRTTKALEVLAIAQRTQTAPNRRSHCPRGHPYDGANLALVKVDGHTWRHCRACKREADRLRYQRSKEEAG